MCDLVCVRREKQKIKNEEIMMREKKNDMIDT
jgi:hypothetical protein